jgi:uncharacterized protein
MLIGRYDLNKKQFQNKNLLIATSLLICCELISYALSASSTPAGLELFLNTLTFPPFPLLIVSGAVCALVAIIICIRIADSVSRLIIDPFIHTGQMVLTHYVAHVLIGMVILETVGKPIQQTYQFYYKSVCDLLFPIRILFYNVVQKI